MCIGIAFADMVYRGHSFSQHIGAFRVAVSSTDSHGPVSISPEYDTSRCRGAGSSCRRRSLGTTFSVTISVIAPRWTLVRELLGAGVSIAIGAIGDGEHTSICRVTIVSDTASAVADA